MPLTSHVQHFCDQTNSPFLSIRNLLNWQLLPDDQARVVPGALVSKVFNILDVLEGVGLGVPCHNVGQQPDLLAGIVQQVLDKARLPGQDSYTHILIIQHIST